MIERLVSMPGDEPVGAALQTAASPGAFDVTRDPSPFRLLLTTPGVVAVILPNAQAIDGDLTPHA